MCPLVATMLVPFYVEHLSFELRMRLVKSDHVKMFFFTFQLDFIFIQMDTNVQTTNVQNQGRDRNSFDHAL
jgi:hypothetical protein